eukprot:scaffold35698_cov63-Attheya_sp.AAC.6
MGKTCFSFHMSTKNWPKICPLLIVPVNSHSNELIGAGPVIEFEYLSEEAAELQNILDRRGKDTINEDVESLMAAKIDGTFSDYVTHMTKNFETTGQSMVGPLIVLDSYDGAEHSTTPGK